jgi:hypothetical protein
MFLQNRIHGLRNRLIVSLWSWWVNETGYGGLEEGGWVEMGWSLRITHQVRTSISRAKRRLHSSKQPIG